MQNKLYPVLMSIRQDKYPPEHCEHDAEHVTIRRFTSVKNPGMYWAIEIERCRKCGVTYKKIWYTPYKDYIAGAIAYNENPAAKIEGLLYMIYELLDLVDHLVDTPPMHDEELREATRASVQRQKSKIMEQIYGATKSR